MSNWPDVAVIMPVLNEEKYLVASVEAIYLQNYPGNLRLVLAIGPSTDKTLQIALTLQSRFTNLQIISSPSGRTPESLNLAIAACHEEFIVRVDAHAELSPRYIEVAIETLMRTGADNVGGIMAAKGKTLFEIAVATAMTSKLGVGNAAFHVGGTEGPAETVYLGVFRRSALERVGGYDSKFTRAQDWEMNHRIINSGGLVWFNPELVVTYRPRSNIQKLVKQYLQYGTWRREVMRAHPETKFRLSALRYFAPPTALIVNFVGLLLGILGIFQENFLILGLVAPVAYVVFTIASAIILGRRAGKSALYLPLVLMAMQMSWGFGFILGELFTESAGDYLIETKMGNTK